MMKICKYSLLFILLAGFQVGKSQDLDWSRRQVAVNTILRVFDEYRVTCNFQVNERFSNSKVNRYQSLFAENALIYDVFNPEKNGASVLMPIERRVEDYLIGIQNNYPNGLDVSIDNISLDYRTIGRNGTVDILLQRLLSTNDRTSFKDTVTLSLQLSPDYRNAIITGVKGAIRPYRIPDGSIVSPLCPELKSGEIDSDGDCIPDISDNCPGEPGSKRTGGCPDSDGDLVIDSRDICPDQPGKPRWDGCPYRDPIKRTSSNLFVGLSAIFGSPQIEFAEESFVGLDNLQNAEGFYGTDGKSALGFGIDLDYLFSGSIGINVGLNYMGFQKEFLLDSLRMEYEQEHPADSFSFNRILTLKGLQETTTINYLMVPVGLTISLPLSEQFGFLVRGGPVFAIPLNSSHTLAEGATADYEAIYSFIDGEPVYNSNSNNDSEITDWEITRAQISDPAYFDELRSAGFEVGLDEAIGAESTTSSFDPSIFIKLDLVALYRISDNLSLHLGGQFLSGAIQREVTEEYQPSINIGTYRSIVNALERASTSSLGFRVGLTLSY